METVLRPEGVRFAAKIKNEIRKGKMLFTTNHFYFLVQRFGKMRTTGPNHTFRTTFFWWPLRLKFLLSRDPATSVTQRTQPPENDAPGKNVLFAGNESFMGVVRGN